MERGRKFCFDPQSKFCKCEGVSTELIVLTPLCGVGKAVDQKIKALITQKQTFFVHINFSDYILFVNGYPTQLDNEHDFSSIWNKSSKNLQFTIILGLPCDGLSDSTNIFVVYNAIKGYKGKYVLNLLYSLFTQRI